MSATGGDCGELSFESQGAKPNLIPRKAHASARGKTEENIKYSHMSPIKSTKSVIVVRGEPGAKCTLERERESTKLATAHLCFMDAVAAEVVVNLAVLGILSNTARSNKTNFLNVTAN